MWRQNNIGSNTNTSSQRRSRGDSDEEINSAPLNPQPAKAPRMDPKYTYLENSCQLTINNPENVLKIVGNLYHERLMCDVYLTVGNKEHAAHRLILCAFSDVFQAMLMKPEWSECHTSKVVLMELPECESVFHLFLEYFYTGKIIITHTNVMAILALADKYIVKSLTKLCVNYMKNHVAHAASHNQLFCWLQYSANCGHKEVARLCQNYLKWNLEAIANTADFNNLEIDLLCNILQCSDVVIFNEIVLYNCVVRWLDLQKIRLTQLYLLSAEIEEHMENMIESAMSCIRFPMMSPRELADLLLSPLVKQYKDFFLDRMALGMTYHSGQIEDIKNLCSTKEGRLLFTPRLYTSDSFNTLLLIENVLNLPSYHTSTFVFPTHMSTADYETDYVNEWVVDIYPKGVWFKKCLLIAWQGSIEVPESVIPTVRLSLTLREPKEDSVKVRVGILLHGMQGGTTHIMQVIEKVHHFNVQDRVMIIDNLIPFEELNPTASTTEKWKSSYLIGMRGDQLKLNVVITPLSSLCYTS